MADDLKLVLMYIMMFVFMGGVCLLFWFVGKGLLLWISKLMQLPWISKLIHSDIMQTDIITLKVKGAGRRDPKIVGVVRGVANLPLWLIAFFTLLMLFWRPNYMILIAGIALVVFGGQAGYNGAWLFGKSVAGPILLDCGAHPTKKLTLGFGVGCFVLGICFLGGEGWRWKFQAIVLLCLGLNVFLFAFGRLQMRENGIWGYVFLLRWNKIESYHSEREADRHTLVCKSTSIGRYFFNSAFFVPLQYKDSVDDILEKYCAIPPGSER